MNSTSRLLEVSKFIQEKLNGENICGNKIYHFLHIVRSKWFWVVGLGHALLTTSLVLYEVLPPFGQTGFLLHTCVSIPSAVLKVNVEFLQLDVVGRKTIIVLSAGSHSPVCGSRQKAPSGDCIRVSRRFE